MTEEKGSDIMFEDEEHENKIAQFVKNRLLKMGIEIKHCRACDREIVFMKTVRGKIMPVSLNLVTHFYDCPKSQEMNGSYDDRYEDRGFENNYNRSRDSRRPY